MFIKTKYSELSEFERKFLITKMTDGCHKSDEFYDKLIELLNSTKETS